MSEFISFEHNIQHFNATSNARIVFNQKAQPFYVVEGTSTNHYEETCPMCMSKMHKHGFGHQRIQDLSIQGIPLLLDVRLQRMKCPCCQATFMQRPGFGSENHRMTKRLEQRIIDEIDNGASIKELSLSLSVHPAIIKDLDKERLKALNFKPKPGVKRIAIDEFLLESHHRYATAVIDLDTTNVLFVEKGKSKDTVYRFFDEVGDEFMKQVVAVSMDMNNQYHSAFKECYQHIDVVYDHFHIIKLYNDTVLTKIRRRLQNQFDASGDTENYKLLKGSRFLLLSKRETIRQQEEEAKKNNWDLHHNYLMKYKSIPPGRRMMRTHKMEKLDQILEMNAELGIAYFLSEQFTQAYEVTDQHILEQGMKDWCRIADNSGILEIIHFKETIVSRMDGILAHAKHHITSGKMEGFNNMIKTIRRKSFGYNDTEYFFLKIKHCSRLKRRYYIGSKSHIFLI